MDDHDRTLARRGEGAVRKLRRHMKRAAVVPALVLCSSSRRTVLTLEGIAPAWPAGTKVKIEAGLYAASSDRLLTRLRRVGDDTASVMLIGHNPGLESLAELLVGSGDEGLRERLGMKFPTGALATLAVDGSWAHLGPGAATLQAFVVPAELP